VIEDAGSSGERQGIVGTTHHCSDAKGSQGLEILKALGMYTEVCIEDVHRYRTSAELTAPRPPLPSLGGGKKGPGG